MAESFVRRKYFDNGSPFIVIRIDPQEPIEMHRHDFSELVLILEGRGVHCVNDEWYPIGAGEAFVISGNMLHGYRDTKGLRLVNILYDPEKLSLPLADIGHLAGYHALFSLEPKLNQHAQFESRLRLGLADLKAAARLADQLEHELTERSEGFGFMAVACFMQLVGLLSRSYEVTAAPAGRSDDSPDILMLANALGYMERHYDRPITLTKLAVLARMSESSLVRAFRTTTGASPIDYLLRFRIQKACELLRYESCLVTEIAFRVGFNDGNYFTRQFTKIMGLPPGRYRKHYAQDAAKA